MQLVQYAGNNPSNIIGAGALAIGGALILHQEIQSSTTKKLEDLNKTFYAVSEHCARGSLLHMSSDLLDSWPRSYSGKSFASCPRGYSKFQLDFLCKDAALSHEKMDGLIKNATSAETFNRFMYGAETYTPAPLFPNPLSMIFGAKPDRVNLIICRQNTYEFVQSIPENTYEFVLSIFENLKNIFRSMY